MPRRPPRHDRDAGGDEAVPAAKAALRAEVRSAMDRPGVGRFPGAEGRPLTFWRQERALCAPSCRRNAGTPPRPEPPPMAFWRQ